MSGHQSFLDPFILFLHLFANLSLSLSLSLRKRFSLNINPLEWEWRWSWSRCNMTWKLSIVEAILENSKTCLQTTTKRTVFFPLKDKKQYTIVIKVHNQIHIERRMLSQFDNCRKVMERIIYIFKINLTSLNFLMGNWRKFYSISSRNSNPGLACVADAKDFSGIS